MTKTELLNVIKACFITWNCGVWNGQTYRDYAKVIEDYDKKLARLLVFELPEDPDDDLERWEHEDYLYILTEWEYYNK